MKNGIICGIAMSEKKIDNGALRYSAAYPTDAPKEALLSEGSRTKCARRDRKGPRESVSRKELFCCGGYPS